MIFSSSRGWFLLVQPFRRELTKVPFMRSSFSALKLLFELSVERGKDDGRFGGGCWLNEMERFE